MNWKLYRSGELQWKHNVAVLCCVMLSCFHCCRVFIVVVVVAVSSCIEKEFPLLAEYDFRNDTHNPDMK